MTSSIQQDMNIARGVFNSYTVLFFVGFDGLFVGSVGLASVVGLVVEEGDLRDDFFVGWGVGFLDGRDVGTRVVGELVGTEEGWGVGFLDGGDVGTLVGKLDGSEEGLPVGSAETVGLDEGSREGLEEGLLDGSAETVGLDEGSREGLEEGQLDGSEEG